MRLRGELDGELGAIHIRQAADRDLCVRVRMRACAQHAYTVDACTWQACTCTSTFTSARACVNVCARTCAYMCTWLESDRAVELPSSASDDSDVMMWSYDFVASSSASTQSPVQA